MKCSPAIFHYTATPNAVSCSDGTAPTPVTLMLAVHNPTEVDVNVSQIVFTIPHGKGSSDLMDNSTVSVAPVEGTHWTIGSDGEGTLTAQPSAPATGLEAGQSIAFTVSGIKVNDLPGLVEVQAWEDTDDIRESLIPVTKVKAGLAITQFTASPIQVQAGGTCTLSWTSTGAASATLEHDRDSLPVETNDSIVVCPKVTTLYTLTVSGQGGSTRQQLTVSVPRLEILSFNASPTRVPMGGPSLLSWEVANADTVVVEPGDIDVDPRAGELAVMPNSRTTYTLVARQAHVMNEMSAWVTVMPVQLDAFSVTPSQLPNGPVTLQWSTRWPSAVDIQPGIGSVEASGSTSVNPLASTEYVLTAHGYGGPYTASRTVTVCPAILRLVLTTTRKPSLGLSWELAGADHVEVSDHGGKTDLPVDGTWQATPTWPRILKFAAVGSGTRCVVGLALPDPARIGGDGKFTLSSDGAAAGLNAAGGPAAFAWEIAGGKPTRIKVDVPGKASDSIPLIPSGRTQFTVGDTSSDLAWNAVVDYTQGSAGTAFAAGICRPGVDPSEIISANEDPRR